MSIYILIDVIIFLLIAYFSILSYQKKYYIKIFEYLKIVVILTFSAKLAPYTGHTLQKLYILSTDTFMVLLLISFSINFLIFYFGWEFIFKILNMLINSDKIKRFFAIFITILEVTIILTFSLFISMQTYPTKKYIYPHMKKSYSYNHIHKFYNKFLNDGFVMMILNSTTSGINHKEVILKSLKGTL